MVAASARLRKSRKWYESCCAYSITRANGTFAHLPCICLYTSQHIRYIVTVTYLMMMMYNCAGVAAQIIIHSSACVCYVKSLVFGRN